MTEERGAGHCTRVRRVVPLVLLAGCFPWVELGSNPDSGVMTPPDAGMSDASVPDASTPDAGPVDAGSPDAGGPDAGVPDSGFVDAGLDDAKLLATWCTTYSHRYCEGEGACSALPSSAVGRCLDFLDNLCSQPLVNLLTDAGWIVFNAAHARTCLDETVDAGCRGGPLQDMCRNGIFEPNAHLGQPCSDNGYESIVGFPESQCVAGTYCKYTASCPGTCQPYESIGTACADSTQCDRSVSYCNQTCRAYASQGDPCFGGLCHAGLYCPLDAGTCKAQATDAGDFCDAPESCATPLYCDLRMRRCVQSFTLTAGATCGYSFECTPSSYCKGFAVLDDGGLALGHCAPLEAIGNACQGYDCVNGATCINNLCTASDGVGDPCNNAIPCQRFTSCLNGACVLNPNPGEPCLVTSDAGVVTQLMCNVGWCSSTTKRCVAPVPNGGACALGYECEYNSYCDAGHCQSFCTR